MVSFPWTACIALCVHACVRACVRTRTYACASMLGVRSVLGVLDVRGMHGARCVRGGPGGPEVFGFVEVACYTYVFELQTLFVVVNFRLLKM